LFDKDDEELNTISAGIRLVIGKIMDDDEIISKLKNDEDTKTIKVIDTANFKKESKDVFFDLLTEFSYQ